MRGYIDCSAADVQANDTILDPVTGVLVRVESVEPVSAAGIVAIHGKGCVSLSYMGLNVKPDRPIRRAPRNGETTQVPGVGEVMGYLDPIGPTRPQYPRPDIDKRCACGMKSLPMCQTLCLKG